MAYDQDILNFWLRDELANIVPDRENEPCPEGFDVHAVVRCLIGESSVVEVGCGYGRLAPAFSPDQYVGYDINPKCVQSAEAYHAGHDFRVSEVQSTYPPSVWTLLYTVALHVPDANIAEFLTQTTTNCNSVLIAEIMGREKWKQPLGKMNFRYAFNRDDTEYVELMESNGFELSQNLKFPYEAYEDCEITFLTFERK